MDNIQNYTVMSLELHLFFARIMKEHSLFLEAAFTPPNIDLAKRADNYKRQFEILLLNVINLSDGIVRPNVINSQEIVTEFTLPAEQQTQYFTGISINKRITKLELGMHPAEYDKISNPMFKQVKIINNRAIRLLNGLINLKEKILNDVLFCGMFTSNYPLLIKHILREAKLYRSNIEMLEKEGNLNNITPSQTEQFWNHIMMEHALFMRGLFDPSENKLIETSNNFAKDYSHLLEKSNQADDNFIEDSLLESLNKTIKFRDFKTAGTQGITECKIKSIILPLLADHVLREANHYIRLLK